MLSSPTPKSCPSRCGFENLMGFTSRECEAASAMTLFNQVNREAQRALGFNDLFDKLPEDVQRWWKVDVRLAHP